MSRIPAPYIFTLISNPLRDTFKHKKGDRCNLKIANGTNVGTD